MLSPLLRIIRNGDCQLTHFRPERVSNRSCAHRSTRRRTHCIAVILFRRFMRIAPCYYLILVAYTPILSAIGCDNCQTCVRVGWMNFLFINNFYPNYFSCMGWTWSIAVEVQFYVVTPFIMMLFNRTRKWGIILLITLLVASFIVRAGVLYGMNMYDHPDGGYYMDVMYVKPYTRAGPYICGMLLACVWALYRPHAREYTPTRAHSLWLLLLQVIAWATIIVLIIFGNGWSADRSLAELFFYIWLNRTVFGICVAFILFACLISGSLRPHQHSGPVLSGSRITALLGNKFAFQYPADTFRWLMSLRVWWVSSQLSYCAYLMHPIWITPFYLYMVHVYEVTFWRYVGYCCVNILMPNLWAFAMHLIVEKPMMNLRYG